MLNSMCSILIKELFIFSEINFNIYMFKMMVYVV